MFFYSLFNLTTCDSVAHLSGFFLVTLIRSHQSNDMNHFRSNPVEMMRIYLIFLILLVKYD